MQTTILVEQPSLPWSETSPYRETRFYRRADQQWLRTMPSAEYWGEPYAIRTAHLRFTYFARDAALVEATADELEQAYIGMYKTLGMEPPSPGEPLTVAVVPEPVGRWSSSIDRLEMTSPVLAQVPEGQSYSDFLAYEVMGWFTYRALRDAAPGTSSRYLYRWPVVVWGLRGWLRDELLTHRSPWRDDLTEVVRARRTEFLPVRLSDISDLRANNDPTREEVILRYVAAESFVRYVAETYGRERLPDLLDGLVKYGRWGEIVPEVFGVSARRLETDWNLFLIEEYDLE
jgi:hypothetical protein